MIRPGYIKFMMRAEVVPDRVERHLATDIKFRFVEKPKEMAKFTLPR